MNARVVILAFPYVLVRIVCIIAGITCFGIAGAVVVLMVGCTVIIQWCDKCVREIIQAHAQP